MADDDVAKLIRALADLEEAPLLAQAHMIPPLMDLAREVLSQRRGTVFDALAGPGKPMTIKALAAELGIHRSKIDDAIKAHRDRSTRAPDSSAGRPVAPPVSLAGTSSCAIS